MKQSLLNRAQFVAEVVARTPGTFAVERVIRGAKQEKGRSFTVPDAVLQPRDCCDRMPAAIVAGGKYWLIAPEQPTTSGFEHVEILKHDDGRAGYLAHLHDLTPGELRALINRWKTGSIRPHDFSTYVDAVDVPNVGACIRGYYHRLLMDLTYMAWGNEDHAQCSPEEAARVRAASATAALATLSFIENGGREGRLVCARKVAEATFVGPDLVERQVRQTKQLYPCIDPRTREGLTDDETAAINAVLRAYINQMHGVNARTYINLYYTTFAPEPRHLRVAVFSPANADAAQQYKSPEVKALQDDLMLRNRRSAQVHAALPHLNDTSHHRTDCVEDAGNTLAVSRPGFSGDKALVYFEYPGGARAYLLTRGPGAWDVDWYVELWQCG